MNLRRKSAAPLLTALLSLIGVGLTGSLGALNSSSGPSLSSTLSAKVASSPVCSTDVLDLWCLGLSIVWFGIVVAVGLLVWKELREPLEVVN